MPRYYFNVMIGDSGNLVADSYGLVCTNVEEARKEAIGLARDLAKQGFLDALGRWKVARFVPHARASEINEFLKEYDASFVGGPKAGGFYRVLIAKKPLPQEELTTIVGRIAQEKIVDFAAAVQ